MLPEPLNLANGLQLRMLADEDLPALTRVMLENLEPLSQWLPDVARIQGPDDVQAWLNRRITAAQDGDGGYCGVWRTQAAPEAQGLVGVVGLHALRTSTRSASMGCFLEVASQGRGIMTIAAGAVIEIAFTTMSLNRLQWDCVATNESSIRLAVRLGFKPEGLLRQAMTHRGGLADSAVLGLLAEEYAPQR